MAQGAVEEKGKPGSNSQCSPEFKKRPPLYANFKGENRPPNKTAFRAFTSRALITPRAYEQRAREGVEGQVDSQ